MADVFISYAREDEALAQRLYQDLRRCGVEPWLDLEDLPVGSNWKREIGLTIRNSKFVLVLLSENSISKKGYAQKEIREAVDVLDEHPESEIFIIPARIDQCEPASRRLADLNWVDLFPSYEKGFEKIMLTLVRDHEIQQRVTQTRAKARDPIGKARNQDNKQDSVEILSAAADSRVNTWPTIRTDFVIRIIGGPDVGKVFGISRMRTIVGRSMDSDIVLQDIGISRVQFAIVFHAASGKYHLFDAGHLVLVNGKSVDRETYLEPGAKIETGRTVMIFEAASSSNRNDCSPRGEDSSA